MDLVRSVGWEGILSNAYYKEVGERRGEYRGWNYYLRRPKEMKLNLSSRCSFMTHSGDHYIVNKDNR